MENSVIKEENDYECKRINTNHLIALCEIGEDYKSFCEDLEKLIKSNYNKNLVQDIYRVMSGHFSIHAGKYRSFIEKHKKTIEILNKYNCLSNLTVLSYDINGNRRKDLSEDYFYQYIQNNKQNVETIKNVALKLKKLGFDSIDFNENLDFTKQEFEVDCSYRGGYFASSGASFSFLENIDIIPTYLQNPIKYKTTGSCYCMNLEYLGFGYYDGIDKYNRNIKLNSLIFDPSKLPDEISVGTTVGVIQKLLEKKKEQYKDLKDSVDLSISLADLEDQFENLKKVLEGIDKVKYNEELSKLLNQMKDILTKLQLLGVNLEKQVIDSHQSISNETMENEKKLYLERRYWSNIDID